MQSSTSPPPPPPPPPQQQQQQHKPMSMTPEAKFSSLSPGDQQFLLNDIPRLVAKAMHGYSRGADCKELLHALLEGAAPLMRARNCQGDAPIASALVAGQADRASWLANLASERNASALTDRSAHRETLLMLCTASLPDGLLESLLERDPSEVHRLYDSDGRNLLHHCALQDSTKALEVTLRCLAKLIAKEGLQAAKVGQALRTNDRNGDTPVHIMAERNQSEMLRLLFHFARQAGVRIDLDTRRHVGSHWTPLMAAARADAVDAVELLLDNGADADETDAENRCIADLVSEVAQPRVTSLLARLQPNTEVTSVPSAVDSGIQSVQGQTSLCRDQLQQPPPQQQPHCRLQDGLSHDKITALERHLNKRCKCRHFLDAISRLSNGRFKQDIELETEDPLRTAFCLWSHIGPVPHELIRRALEEVGEEEAAKLVG